MIEDLQISLNKSDFDLFTAELKLAFDNHLQWLSDLNCAMICNKNDINSFCLGEAPHQQCKFGKWYYNNLNPNIVTHPDFILLGEMHVKLHQTVCSLVIDFKKNNTPSVGNYHKFKEAEESFLNELKMLLHDNLEAKVNTDHLTELPNRHALDVILKQEHSRIKRKKCHSSIVILDIDYFKAVNDTYGHKNGDKVLKCMANLLLDNIRDCDFIARYGGEEFIIYFPETDCETAIEIAEKLRALIEAESFTFSTSEQISLTCSFGIAAFTEDISIKHAIADADRALYKAKDQGRNKVVVFKDESPLTGEGGQ